MITCWSRDDFWLIRSRVWSCDMIMWSLCTCCHVTNFGWKYTRSWHWCNSSATLPGRSRDLEPPQTKPRDWAPRCPSKMDFCFQWRLSHLQPHFSSAPGQWITASLVWPTSHPRTLPKLQFGAPGPWALAWVWPRCGSGLVWNDAGAWSGPLWWRKGMLCILYEG